MIEIENTGVEVPNMQILEYGEIKPKVKTAEPIVGEFGYSNDFLDKMLEKLLYGKRRSNSKS